MFFSMGPTFASILAEKGAMAQWKHEGLIAAKQVLAAKASLAAHAERAAARRTSCAYCGGGSFNDNRCNGCGAG